VPGERTRPLGGTCRPESRSSSSRPGVPDGCARRDARAPLPDGHRANGTVAGPRSNREPSTALNGQPDRAIRSVGALVEGRVTIATSAQRGIRLRVSARTQAPFGVEEPCRRETGPRVLYRARPAQGPRKADHREGDSRGPRSTAASERSQQAPHTSHRMVRRRSLRPPVACQGRGKRRTSNRFSAWRGSWPIPLLAIETDGRVGAATSIDGLDRCSGPLRNWLIGRPTAKRTSKNGQNTTAPQRRERAMSDVVSSGVRWLVVQ